MVAPYYYDDESRNYGGDGGGNCYGGYSISMDSNSYVHNNWAHIAETTMPLVSSKHTSTNGVGRGGGGGGHDGSSTFEASIELRSRQLSTKVIIVNLISLLVNLLLAIVAFYFAFKNNSATTTAFAADCVLDFISSAIVLWRYYGNLNSVLMQAREQIACVYLGALFIISALAIIIKGISDMSWGPSEAELANVEGSVELVILAVVATIACIILTVFKCNLYKLLRDNSMLMDVVNTLISTVFAMSIVMSQILLNVNPSFWYLDPILSIFSALFMAGFGLKVLHENFNILKPSGSLYN